MNSYLTEWRTVDSEQTAGIRRPIWVNTGRIGYEITMLKISMKVALTFDTLLFFCEFLV